MKSKLTKTCTEISRSIATFFTSDQFVKEVEKVKSTDDFFHLVKERRKEIAKATDERPLEIKELPGLASSMIRLCYTLFYKIYKIDFILIKRWSNQSSFSPLCLVVNFLNGRLRVNDNKKVITQNFRSWKYSSLSFGPWASGWYTTALSLVSRWFSGWRTRS